MTSAVDCLFGISSFDEESVDDFVESMKDVTVSDSKKEKFDTAVKESISKINGGSTSIDLERAVYDITVAQILPEAADYKNESINTAFESQISKLFELQNNILDFEDFSDAIMNEPFPAAYDDLKIYDTTLSYYRNPRTVFADEYLPKYIDQKKSRCSGNKGHRKNHGSLLRACRSRQISRFRREQSHRHRKNHQYHLS